MTSSSRSLRRVHNTGTAGALPSPDSASSFRFFASFAAVVLLWGVGGGIGCVSAIGYVSARRYVSLKGYIDMIWCIDIDMK